MATEPTPGMVRLTVTLTVPATCSLFAPAYEDGDAISNDEVLADFIEYASGFYMTDFAEYDGSWS